MRTLQTAKIAVLSIITANQAAIAQAQQAVKGSRKAELPELAWVIGLVVASILALVTAGWAIARLRKWRKELNQINAGESSFSLSQMKEMQAKGLISQQEYEQLKKAYVNGMK